MTSAATYHQGVRFYKKVTKQTKTLGENIRIQICYNILSKISSFQQRIMIPKKSSKVWPTCRKKQTIEIVPECTQMLDLEDKDCKVVIIIIFKEWKEYMFKELKRYTTITEK